MSNDQVLQKMKKTVLKIGVTFTALDHWAGQHIRMLSSVERESEIKRDRTKRTKSKKGKYLFCLIYHTIVIVTWSFICMAKRFGRH